MTSERHNEDRLLFLGNPQQCVPKSLLLARNLSPRDKFTWQLLRLHAPDEGNGAFPTGITGNSGNAATIPATA